jgi:hypothetical protein
MKCTGKKNYAPGRIPLNVLYVKKYWGGGKWATRQPVTGEACLPEQPSDVPEASFRAEEKSSALKARRFTAPSHPYPGPFCCARRDGWRWTGTALTPDSENSFSGVNNSNVDASNSFSGVSNLIFDVSNPIIDAHNPIMDAHNSNMCVNNSNMCAHNSNMCINNSNIDAHNSNMCVNNSNICAHNSNMCVNNPIIDAHNRIIDAHISLSGTGNPLAKTGNSFAGKHNTTVAEALAFTETPKL